MLKLEGGNVRSVTPGAHKIKDTGSGYILKTGASTKRVNYDGTPARESNPNPFIGSKNENRENNVDQNTGSISAKLEEKNESKPELEGVNKVLSGVEEHNSKKDNSTLYRLRTKVSALRGKGKRIDLNGDSSSRVDTETFEDFFSPLIREHPSEVDYEGSMPEEAHRHLLEDIIEKNETRVESCIGEGEERQPEILAYDTGEEIVYEGLVHLLIDTEMPLGEEPFELVGDPHEEEFEVRVEVPYEEATQIPESDTGALEAEEQIFEKEVSYN